MQTLYFEIRMADGKAIPYRTSEEEDRQAFVSELLETNETTPAELSEMDFQEITLLYLMNLAREGDVLLAKDSRGRRIAIFAKHFMSITALELGEDVRMEEEKKEPVEVTPDAGNQ